jgi:hypothetical protein
MDIPKSSRDNLLSFSGIYEHEQKLQANSTFKRRSKEHTRLQQRRRIMLCSAKSKTFLDIHFNLISQQPTSSARFPASIPVEFKENE